MTTRLPLTPSAGQQPAADATQTLVTRLAVALNRRRAYRPMHPMVVRAEQQLLETISVVLDAQAEFKIEIAPRELRVDGQRLRSRLSVTREVAARLHRRGLSSLTLLRGINREGVRAMLGWMTSDSPAVSALVGEHAPDTADALGFILGHIPYDQLVLTDSTEGTEEQISALWSALGNAALGRRDTLRDDFALHNANANHVANITDATSAADIARAICGRTNDPVYAAQISGVLFTLVDQATHATSRQRAIIGERLRAVLQLLDDQSIASILTHIGSPEQQKLFMEQVAEALPVNAVVDWLEVAARAGRRNLSHHLLRLLRKLSTLAAGTNVGSGTDMSFRDAAHNLVSGWDLDDPDPCEHVELLDQIALIESDRAESANDANAPVTFMGESHGESARLVQMALEIDDVDEDSRAAARQLVVEGQAAAMMEWIAQCDGTIAATELRSVAASPEMLQMVLLREPPDIAVARALLPAAGEIAIPTLFDVLAASGVRMVRRLVYDRLREFGRPIWPEVLQRLDNTTWFFARNLLGLMRDVRASERAVGGNLDSLPLSGVTRYLSHAREQLRLEAVRLLLDEPAMRDGALRRALDDSNVRVVREALEFLVTLAADNEKRSEGKSLISGELFTRLLQVVENKALPEELRARGVWALDACRGPQARMWLIQHTTHKRFFRRRLILARSSPTVLAALGLLSDRYGDDPTVRSVLAMAKEMNDLRGHVVSRASQQTAGRRSA